MSQLGPKLEAPAPTFAAPARAKLHQLEARWGIQPFTKDPEMVSVRAMGWVEIWSRVGPGLYELREKKEAKQEE